MKSFRTLVAAILILSLLPQAFGQSDFPAFWKKFSSAVIAGDKASFESKLAEQETRIESLTSNLQKVSLQVELSELTRQVVLNKQ
jgi:hypothetical protein